ncbi:MAG: filamentous hemagglutinin N-terminal domain-containing protein, partial [Phycisphaeraceae bacterium]
MARYDKQQRRRQRSIRKRFSRNRRVNRFASAAGMGALAAMAMPWANSVVYADSPQGANPVHGNVAIYKDGQLMQIHASNNAVIDYESFNIGAGYTVEFIQPGQMSRVLNRVISGDPTRIDGNLTANGQVYIASPGGIFFGNNAVIDVAGLVAGAGNISDSDFLQGNDRFTNMSGSVINDGTIQGKAIALLGDYVANRGTIIAPEGMVTMSAGDEVFLGSRNGNIMVRLEGGDAERETAAVENEGTIDAGQTGRVSLGAGDVYNLAVRNTGSIRGNQVIVSGEGSRVEVAGNIDASNANGQGGEVQVLGEQVVVHDGATIDASGSTGGGNIYIGGDYQGGGELYTADTTFVSADATLRADAIDHGDGGEVIVWADGATGFLGQISARGGEFGGDGGFAEVSGKLHLNYQGLTDLRAPAGQA